LLLFLLGFLVFSFYSRFCWGSQHHVLKFSWYLQGHFFVVGRSTNLKKQQRLDEGENGGEVTSIWFKHGCWWSGSFLLLF
jgi:hypothetical protein